MTCILSADASYVNKNNEKSCKQATRERQKVALRDTVAIFAVVAAVVVVFSSPNDNLWAQKTEESRALYWFGVRP